MPRIRSVKPEAPQHRKVGRLGIHARWLWLVMITQADDEGRLVADPGQLRLVAFGYDQDVTDDKVANLLEEIASVGLIQRYEVGKVPYAHFPSWKDHQRIDRPKPSKCPSPPEMRSTKPRRRVTDPSATHRADQGRDQGGDQGSRSGRDGIGGEREGNLGDASPRPPAVVVSDSKPSTSNVHSASAGNTHTHHAPPNENSWLTLLAGIQAQHPDWTREQIKEAGIAEANRRPVGSPR